MPRLFRIRPAYITRTALARWAVFLAVIAVAHAGRSPIEQLLAPMFAAAAIACWIAWSTRSALHASMALGLAATATGARAASALWIFNTGLTGALIIVATWGHLAYICAKLAAGGWRMMQHGLDELEDST